MLINQNLDTHIEEYIEYNSMGSYLEYAYNVYSQNGEDGIISKILEELEINTGIVVEFGAWDGVYLSNVLNLTQNKNFNSILIESDYQKVLNFKSLKNSKIYNYSISPYRDDKNSIDNILKEIGIKSDVVLMSIDIDSCDYYVFDSIAEYNPYIIIIETDISMGIDIDFKSYDRGCSFNSVWNLSKTKNYTMVSYTGNCILVRNDFMHKLKNFNKTKKEDLFIDENQYILLQKLDEFGNIGDDINYLSDKYNQKINKFL
jgi:hypothetical protein